MSIAPLLNLQQVSKRFKHGTLALQDLNLSIEAGSFVSILGPSGCGKSTVLRIMAGLTQPSSGTMHWHNGTTPADQAAKGDISFVFQEPALLPWATVFDNVFLPLRLQGVKKSVARSRINQALEMVDLSTFAQAYPRQLSGGMKMRVSIARAIVTRPSIVLMDEPFAALDEITRFKLNDELLDLWQQFKWTVIFVTHSVFESVYLSSQIFIMSARPGRIINTINIDAAQPRSPDFRTSSSYNGYCQSTQQALQQAITQHVVSS